MPSGVPKSVTTTMRFDEDELAFLKERRKIMQLRSVTGLVRVCIRMALGIPNLQEQRLLQLQQHLIQVRGMAGNLNQMAKAANAGKFRLNKRTEDLMIQMDEEIHELRGLIEHYIKVAKTRSLTEALELERKAEEARAHRTSPKVRALLEQKK